MYAPHFVLRSFSTLSDEAKIPVLLHLLEALIAANVAHLLEHPTTPWLYDTNVTYRGRLFRGVVYVAEPDMRDDWQDIPETIERGEGDCEDLASWRIAELRVRSGEAAIPTIKSAVVGKLTVFHVAVQRPDGQLEDPSRVLGMNR